jgi:hypothetical protein
MAARNKNNEAIDPIIKYLNDQMLPEERNEFERNLQRDPFEAEALEGFATLPAKVLLQDLYSLNGLKESPQISKIIKPVVLATIVALGLASLIYLAILFIPGIINKIDFQKITETVSFSNSHKEEPLKTAPDRAATKIQSADITENDTIREHFSPKDLGTQYAALKKEQEIIPVNLPVKKTTKPINNKIIEPLKPIDLSQINTKKESQNQQLSFQPLNEEKSENHEKLVPTGNQLMNENNQEDANSDRIVSGWDIEPKPIGGEKLYKTYLETNCRYPSHSGKNSRETVRIKFKVSTNGNPHQIAVTKSPGPDFSNEAIRLIVEGPRWSPAILDGKPVVGEVNLRINFKP